MSDAQLRRSARLARLSSWVGIAVLIVIPALVWLDPSVGDRWPDRIEPWTWDQRLAAWAFTAVPPALLAFGLAGLTRFCRGIDRETPLTRRAASAIGDFARGVTRASLTFPFSRLGVWWIAGGLPIGRAEWGRLFFGPIMMSTVIGLVIGLTLTLFSLVLVKAAEVAEENARFF